MSLLDDIKEKLDNIDTSFMHPRALAQIKNNMYACRQFIFDEEASRTVGRFIRHCPDFLVENAEFARPPYNPCYIEVDIDSMYQEVRSSDYFQGKTLDYRVGFLIIDNCVFTVVNEKEQVQPFLGMFGVYFKDGAAPFYHDIPLLADPELEEIQLLGTTFHSVNAKQRRYFRSKFGVFHTSRVLSEHMTMEHLRGNQGEARTFAAVLLMLYNKRNVTITERPAERRLSRGKLRTYMAYSVVQISLTAPVELRRAFHTGERGPTRRHEVRTHYAHLKIQPRCEHQWIRNEYADNEQWECAKCHGLRYLRREHLRGDATKGFVNKRYEVKP